MFEFIIDTTIKIVLLALVILLSPVIIYAVLKDEYKFRKGRK